MDVNKIYRNMLIVSLLGFLYALYFVWQRLTAVTCSFTCVELFGIPSCYYGLAGFALLLLITVAVIKGRLSLKVAKAFAFLGTLFALYVSLLELPLGFPLCSVGAALFFLYACMAHRAETGECPFCKVRDAVLGGFKLR